MTASSVARALARTLFALAMALAAAAPAGGERIRDLVSVQGARPNQLVGYGIVVGLDQSGDQTTQTPFTVQSVLNMLSQLGVNLPADRLTSIQLKNVAAVMVTATLPPFARPGQSIDVVASSLGNAKSLRGGTLLLTPLKGADGEIYAMAQGNVVVGGAGASSAGSKVQVNHLSAGRVPGGATVERAVPARVGDDDAIQLELAVTDFGTVSRIVDAINGRFADAPASAVDGRVVRVAAPADPGERVAFIARLEALDVVPARTAAKVIVNSRTGSVVMNQTVTVEACAVAHGGLSVVVSTEPVVSQPAPFSQGETILVPRSDVQVRQEQGSLMVIPRGAALADIVKALNAVGATPLDLMSILQAMKAAGALRAELEVI
ncbi:MAG: flagellar basal body P-ring protein FlgI [Burkholderiales bacterium]|nr:flagellar basal body P-ring protein FlgI [Burkholderiales bacterium]